MADTFSDIAKNASSMSVTELGSSLLGRKEATQKAQQPVKVYLKMLLNVDKKN